MSMRRGARRKRGCLVVFSGLDGAGKSTQIQILLSHCAQNGLRPEYLWSRGGYSPGMEFIKRVLRRLAPGKSIASSGDNPARSRAFTRPIVRKLWLLAAILDLHWLYGVRLRLWLRQGKVVIADRYLLDTRIDFGLNFPAERCETWRTWHSLTRLAPDPDLAFMLLVPVEVSLRRSDEKKEPYRDTPAVLAHRLALYRQAAEQAPWIVLDGQRPVEEICAQVRMEFEEQRASRCSCQETSPHLEALS